MKAYDYLSLLQGAAVTVSLSLVGIVLGVPLGLALALVRWSGVPVLARMVAAYVSVLRATPLVTLALLVFFALPNVGVPIDPVPAAILSLAMNTSAFNCEIWRAALNDFPRAQLDAATAAGMTPGLEFRRIVFPQIWRVSLPGLVNEMTLLIKSSPAIAVVGIVDITRAAVRIGAQTYEPLPPFLAATALYFLVVLGLVRAQRAIEVHLDRKFGFA
ncbi:MAG TPA: amino acid ABC transporter permease [Xanthobacteraceae bacterium]|nr:amino acid ABC transporter permease [Xanthobacteraceae bacterium]